MNIINHSIVSSSTIMESPFVASSSATTDKISWLAKGFFAKMAFYCQVALQAGWCITKNAAMKGVAAVKSAASSLLGLLKTGGVKLLNLAAKLGRIAVNFFINGAKYIGNALKNGFAQGWQISKTFFAAHQKEAIIAGIGVLAGMTLYYIGSRLFSSSPKEPAHQTV